MYAIMRLSALLAQLVECQVDNMSRVQFPHVTVEFVATDAQLRLSFQKFNIWTYRAAKSQLTHPKHTPHISARNHTGSFIAA